MVSFTGMTSSSFYQQAQFLISAATIEQLPADRGYEAAFIGRSNAGKSSALNAITGIKGLARVSKTPGRTQMINLFELSPEHRLADLPGYGYAKVPLNVKERWEKTIDCYLQSRQCLRGLVLIMDIRHPLKEIDREVIDWTVDCGIPIHILLTKADKLKASAARKVLKEVQSTLEPYSNQISLQLFSSLDHTGLDQARAQLTRWFELKTA